MESIHKLEDKIEVWLKPLPHLPTTWRKWLSGNVWWIVLVGVIISAFGIFSLFSALSFLTATTNYYGAVLQEAGVQVHGSLWSVSIYISIALLVVTVVLEAMAISPLKTQNKKGWDLMFLAYLIGIASSVISALLNLEIMSLIGAAISAVIGAYFLFEIRSYFKLVATVKK